MSQSHTQRGVAFEVNFEPSSKNRQCATPPVCLKAKQRKTEKQDIDAKLKRAEEKRKLQEQQRLDRIHARQEHCRKMATKMELLLQQDAKRQGMAGAESIPVMSRRQAAAVIRSVARDFESMGSEMQQNTADISKEPHNQSHSS